MLIKKFTAETLALIAAVAAAAGDTTSEKQDQGRVLKVCLATKNTNTRLLHHQYFQSGAR